MHISNTSSKVSSLTNKQSVYRLLEGTSTMYISMHTCKYKQLYRHSQYNNKCIYRHHQILSSVRQDKLHDVSSKMFHIGKHEKNIKENGKWTDNCQWGNRKGSSRGD